MTLSGAVAIAGVYEHPTRWAPDKTEFQIMAESAKGALDDAGLTIGDVDALFAASMTMSGMGIVDLAEYLDLKPDYLDGTNIGGSSFVAHVAHAAAAIHAGHVRGRPRALRQHRGVQRDGHRHRAWAASDATRRRRSPARTA